MSEQRCPKCGANQLPGPRYTDGCCIFHTQEGKRRVTKHTPSGQDYPSLVISEEAEDPVIKQTFMAKFNHILLQRAQGAIDHNNPGGFAIPCQRYIFPAFSRDEWHQMWTIDHPDIDETRYGIGGGRTIPMGIIFQNCQFNGDVRFDGTTFIYNFIMTECIVAGTAIFNDATFSFNAHFTKTVFNQTAYFIGAAFDAGNHGGDIIPFTDFQQAVFLGSISPLAPQKINDTAQFIPSEFAFRNASVLSGIYEGAAIFDSAKFSHTKSDFCKAHFIGTTSLTGVQFGVENSEGSVDFREAQFHGNALIYRADFILPVCFDGTIFGKKLKLEGVTIHKSVSFDFSKFRGEALFYKIYEKYHTPMVTFREAEIYNHFSIQGHRNIPTCIPELRFGEVKIYDDAQILFKDFNLSKTSFLGSNFWLFNSRISFNRVKWPRKGRYRVIYDDFLQNMPLEEGKQKEKADKPFYSDGMLEDLEQQYRQIRMAYESRGCYTDAGDFFAGEMNAKGARLKQALKMEIPKEYGRTWIGILGKKPTLRERFTDLQRELQRRHQRLRMWISEYRILTGKAVLFAMHWLYGKLGKWGESPARVVFWLVFFMLGLLPVVLLASGGFEVKGVKQEFDLLCWDSCEFDYSYYQNAVIYIFQTMLLRFPDAYSTTGFLASLPGFFARILGPTLIAILGVSLRRRFRRSSGE